MNEVQPLALPALAAYHVRCWSRTDARLKTQHSIPLWVWAGWSPHDIIVHYGLT